MWPWSSSHADPARSVRGHLATSQEPRLGNRADISPGGAGGVDRERASSTQQPGKLLAERGYRVDVVSNPTGGQARDRLHDLMPGDLLAAGGALVVMWAGHGEPSSESGLHLVTTNSHRGRRLR